MLRERMPVDEMAVFLADRSGLRPIYCTGPKADLLRNLHVPIGDSPTGWVAGHGETLLNGNPMRECGDLGTMAWLLGLNSVLVAPAVGSRPGGRHDQPVFERVGDLFARARRDSRTTHAHTGRRAAERGGLSDLQLQRRTTR